MRDKRTSPDDHSTSLQQVDASPGKRVRTESVASVQRKTTSASSAAPFYPLPPAAEHVERPQVQFLESLVGGTAGESHEQVQTLARAGTSGHAEQLPFLDVIQGSFGKHDVTGISSHSDAAAQAATAGMGAAAFASGNHVAFAGAPDLHTAAHEAAHVVQQRGGVQLAGGVGAEGDLYERHADDVADKVVRGESAAALLDSFAPAGGGSAGPVQMKRPPATNRPLPYDVATNVIDAYTRELEANLAQLKGARGLKQHDYVRSVARLVNMNADRLEESAHSIQAEHQEEPRHPMNAKAEATAPLVAKARELADRTLEQLDASDRAREATAELREGIAEPKSVEELKERARRVANLGICDEHDMQGSPECPLDNNSRNLAREQVKLTFLIAASNWNDAIQDKHQEVLREQPEAISPIVDILISVAIGRLFSVFAGFKSLSDKGPTTPGDGDGIGGVAQGKAVRDALKDLGKEVSGAGKKRLADAVKSGMGGSGKDAKVSLLELIRPTIENWRDEMGHALHHLPDADLVTFAERVKELQATFTVDAFRANVDATLDRFKGQVLSLGTGTMIEGTQAAWVFDPVSGERSRRLALIRASTKTARYRREDYTTRDGAWTFIQWVDDDMSHPAIERSASNRRDVLDLEAPGGKTEWTNPDAVRQSK